MRFLLLISAFLLISGCGNSRKTKNLIPKEQLVKLLVDLHMVDAIVTDHTLNSLTGNLDSLTIYTSVLHKYNTNKTQFDATMEWYSNNPVLLDKVYDNVFGAINRNTQNWSDQLELFSGNKSEELFKTKRYIDTRGDTVKYPAPFYINIDSAGIYLIDIRIRMLEDDQSVNPRIIAYFLKDKSESTDSLQVLNNPISKSNFSRDYQYVVELNDSTYKYLKVIVPQIDNIPTTFRKNLQLSSLKVSKIKEVSDRIEMIKVGDN